jgi:two-component system phosphate regulon response regulator PhoB
MQSPIKTIKGNMMQEDAAILVVEDEPAIAELVLFVLRQKGWECVTVSSVGKALMYLQEKMPRLILLDWMLPDQSGLSFLTQIRSTSVWVDLPVIMLTAKGMEEDKVAGLEKGADDYITKPFSPRELIARIEAVLRRKRPGQGETSLILGSIALDPVSYTVTVSGEKVEMGHTEFKLLKFFLGNPNRVFSRATLLDKVWGNEVYIEERTVDVHVLRLRKALKESGDLIKTIRSVGYMLRED